MLVPTNSFKTLITCGCVFFSPLFFIILVLSVSGIAIFGAIEKAGIAEVGTELSFTCFYSLKQTFLGVVYSVSFLILQYNTCFINSWDGFLVDDDRFV